MTVAGVSPVRYATQKCPTLYVVMQTRPACVAGRSDVFRQWIRTTLAGVVLVRGRVLVVVDAASPLPPPHALKTTRHAVQSPAERRAFATDSF
jgi:hypothetical protein